MQTGILIHVRHLQTLDWETLVWGVPAEDKMGNLPMLVELLLTECKSEPVTTIAMGCASSQKDGLSEGEYHKQYLLRRLPDVKEFPRLKNLMPKEGSAAYRTLQQRLEGIFVSPVIRGTREEIEWAAKLFKKQGVAKVIQVTAASHAPRCIQLQSILRAEGVIDKDQRWSVIADDMCFANATPSSTVILEPPHRGDDPLMGAMPTLGQALNPFFSLSAEDKHAFLAYARAFMDEHLAKHNGKYPL